MSPFCRKRKRAEPASLPLSDLGTTGNLGVVNSRTTSSIVRAFRTGLIRTEESVLVVMIRMHRGSSRTEPLSAWSVRISADRSPATNSKNAWMVQLVHGLDLANESRLIGALGRTALHPDRFPVSSCVSSLIFAERPNPITQPVRGARGLSRSSETTEDLLRDRSGRPGSRFGRGRARKVVRVDFVSPHAPRH
jgi:hypothetical protein